MNGFWPIFSRNRAAGRMIYRLKDVRRLTT